MTDNPHRVPSGRPGAPVPSTPDARKGHTRASRTARPATSGHPDLPPDRTRRRTHRVPSGYAPASRPATRTGTPSRPVPDHRPAQPDGPTSRSSTAVRAVPFSRPGTRPKRPVRVPRTTARTRPGRAPHHRPDTCPGRLTTAARDAARDGSSHRPGRCPDTPPGRPAATARASSARRPGRPVPPPDGPRWTPHPYRSGLHLVDQQGATRCE